MNVGVNLVNYRHCGTALSVFSGDTMFDDNYQNFVKVGG
jgi:hypothetical protein